MSDGERTIDTARKCADASYVGSAFALRACSQLYYSPLTHFRVSMVSAFVIYGSYHAFFNVHDLHETQSRVIRPSKTKLSIST